MTDHLVGLDLGPTRCAVAVRRGAEAAAPLEPDGTIPATLAFTADGSVLIGEAAERHAQADPACVLRDVVRRVGDPTPIVVADRTLTAEEAAALFLTGIVDALAARLGRPPAGVALAHPAGWTNGAVARVLVVLGAYGLKHVMPVPAPLAVVTAQRGRRGTVAAVELGTDLTVSVVRVPERGPATVLGRPVSVPHVAGEAFDDLVLAHVRAALGPTWSRLDPEDPRTRGAVAELRRRCRRAKDQLSVATAVEVEVELPGVQACVPVERDHFEQLAAAALDEVVGALGAALEAAEIGPADLDDVVLTGDSAPLVARTLGEALGRPVVADPAPLAALGAVVLCGERRKIAPVHPVALSGPRHARPAPAPAPSASGPRHARPTQAAPAGALAASQADPRAGRHTTRMPSSRQRPRATGAVAAAALSAVMVSGVGSAPSEPGGAPAAHRP